MIELKSYQNMFEKIKRLTWRNDEIVLIWLISSWKLDQIKLDGLVVDVTVVLLATKLNCLPDRPKKGGDWIPSVSSIGGTTQLRPEWWDLAHVDLVFPFFVWFCSFVLRQRLTSGCCCFCFCFCCLNDIVLLMVYIYAEHKGSEPRQDSFRFHVRDTSANRSPPLQLDIVIEVSTESSFLDFLYWWWIVSCTTSRNIVYVIPSIV